MCSPHIQPVIYLPSTASARKRRKLQDAGASLKLFGDDVVDTEREARRVAVKQGIPYISPYNDLQVISRASCQGLLLAVLNTEGDVCVKGAPQTSSEGCFRTHALQISGGQGTIACELLAQLQPQSLDAVFVPVGGGGLISGAHC